MVFYHWIQEEVDYFYWVLATMVYIGMIDCLLWFD